VSGEWREPTILSPVRRPSIELLFAGSGLIMAAFAGRRLAESR
jgi:hypothetical protein